MWFDRGTFQANLCLSSEVAYNVVSYYEPTSFSFDFEYSQNGELIATAADVITAGTSGSTLLLPLDSEPEPSTNFTDMYEPTTDVDGCTSTEAELELSVNAVMWATLFDANSDGTTVTANRTCIPKGRHYSLLVGLNAASAEQLVVKLNGLVIREVQGPFFNNIWSLPRIVSTIITPDMLLQGLKVAPASAAPLTFAPVTAAPTPEPSTARFASPLDCSMVLLLTTSMLLVMLMYGH
jgi:hypothetical protein